MDATASNQEIMEKVKAEMAVAQVQELMQKTVKHCFKTCVGRSGSSLSSSEQRCISNCVDRYFDSMAVVSEAYLNKLKSYGSMDQ